MAELFIPRRVRQRDALAISADEMAAELRITTEQLVVVEAQNTLPRSEASGRAWDLALGRIVKAHQDAAHDEEAAAREDSADTSDALRRWGERPDSPESAHGAATAGHTRPVAAEPAHGPVPSTQPKKRRMRQK